MMKFENLTIPATFMDELSVSQLWFVLYRRLYAEETGKAYNPDDKQLIKEADGKYPLPKKLDFRMHD